MRAVIQRVSRASVEIEKKIVASVGQGLLILLGIEDSDNVEDCAWLSGKIVRLRVFNDDQGVMNRSVSDIDGEILVVSQFTLHASTKKGNRPSYFRAAKPEVAVPLYQEFIRNIENDLKKHVQKGEFGAMMNVSLTNDGPVTIIIDTKNKE